MPANLIGPLTLSGCESLSPYPSQQAYKQGRRFGIGSYINDLLTPFSNLCLFNRQRTIDSNGLVAFIHKQDKPLTSARYRTLIGAQASLLVKQG